jgi:beta-glucanase (GH16 family)
VSLVTASGSRLHGWTPPGSNVIFEDNFTGDTLDTDKWTGPFERIQDLVNGEVGGQLPANVRVDDGLFIDSKYVPEGFESGDSETAPQEVFYSAGQIQQKTAPFQYGTVTVRFKAPGGTGLWPLAWMLGFEWQASQPFTANTPEHNWPNAGWCEIDIVESLSNDRDRNNCAVWFFNGTTGNGSAENVVLDVPSDSQFIVYKLEWQVNLLRWSASYDDGETFETLRTITDPDQIPNVPMYVILSTATGGVGAGAPNSATFPQTQTVTNVRVTQ